MLRIIHYNDVYETQSRSKDPCGGAARFAGKLKALASAGSGGSGAGSGHTHTSAPPLVLFSGDALNPSRASTITRG